jgi:tRNA threonylcarbamoyladenosine biosynthesis protein TsaB
MLCLRQLLARHGSLLVLDAASATIQAGWIDSEAAMSFTSSIEEAGIGLFQCLDTLKRPIDGAGAFVFCDGPGSVLGVRTAAAAVRAWNVLSARPVYGYHSLTLLAHALRRADTSVICDARRDSWHCLKSGSALVRIPAANIPRDVVMPEGFRNWTALPPDLERVPYSLAEMFPRVLDAEMLISTDAPDAFLHEEPSYVTWAPHIHRAP